MRLYDEMTTVRAPYGGDLIGGFTCFRQCPKCRRQLRTDGDGLYLCTGCGYRDKKDVSKLKPLGRKFEQPRRHYGALTHLFGTEDL